MTTTQKNEMASLIPLAYEAHLFAYPLILMEYHRRVMTNVTKAKEGRAPMGQMVRGEQDPIAIGASYLPNPDFKEFSAWLDVLDKPMVLSVPNIRGRFYVISLFDAWGNIFRSIGTRATGEWKGNFALVPHGFKGTLPKGVMRLECPTRTVRLAGRIQCHGLEEMKTVGELSEAVHLVPLKAFGNGTSAKMMRLIGRFERHRIDRSIITDVDPSVQLEKIDPLFFLQMMSELVKDNPPDPQMKKFLEGLGELGFKKDRSLVLNDIDRTTHMAIDKGAEKARKAMAEVEAHIKAEDWEIWAPRTRTVEHAKDHLQRALMTGQQMGIDLPDDYRGYITGYDSERRPLDGNKKYVMHFDKDGIPPTNAFWSLVLYDSALRLSKNRLDRSSLGSLDALIENKDGSIDISIQSFPPLGGSEVNWLPAPMEGFTLSLNLYFPKVDEIAMNWKPPLVTKMD